MNYRHAFHAGNFADVFKHAFLARLLAYLARKEAPFRVIDTHAGEGAYDLSGDESERTGEWRGGIGKFADVSAAPAEVAILLRPYLDSIGPVAEGRPLLYPGSPLLTQKLMRPNDRAIFCELREDAFVALRRRFARDKRIKAIHIDGYTGVGAFVPPMERRGLVLIDPPFERVDEFDAMLEAFLAACRKWPTGIYALWHPIKDVSSARAFFKALQEHGVRRALRLEICIGGAGERLTRAGLIVVNPPYLFDNEARTLLPFLTERMAQGQSASFAVEELTGE